MFTWYGWDGTDGGLERSQLNLYASVCSCHDNNCQELENNPYVLWYVHMIDYYSTVKRNALLTYRVTWMSLKIIRQNGKGQTKKKRMPTIYFLLYDILGKDKFRDKNRSSVACSWRSVSWGD